MWFACSVAVVTSALNAGDRLFRALACEPYFFTVCYNLPKEPKVRCVDTTTPGAGYSELRIWR